MKIHYQRQVVPGVFVSGGTQTAVAALVIHIVGRVLVLGLALYALWVLAVVAIPFCLLAVMLGTGRRRYYRRGLWGYY